MSRVDNFMNSKYLSEAFKGARRARRFTVLGNFTMRVGVGCLLVLFKMLIYILAFGFTVLVFPFWCLEKLIKEYDD